MQRNAYQWGVLAALRDSWSSLGNGTLLVDTPVCELAAAMALASGRTLEVIPAFGGDCGSPPLHFTSDVELYLSISWWYLAKNLTQSTQHKKSVETSVVRSTHRGSCTTYCSRTDNVRAHADMNNRFHWETCINNVSHLKKVQFMLTRSPWEWSNHTRSIYRWLCSRLQYRELQDFDASWTER